VRKKYNMNSTRGGGGGCELEKENSYIYNIMCGTNRQCAPLPINADSYVKH
jgi:hypothetical protein